MTCSAKIGSGVRFFALLADRGLSQQGQHRLRDIGRSIAEGYRTIAASPAMRMTVLQSCAMGTCFMGSYIVTLPLLVREYYNGSATDLALIFVWGMCGGLAMSMARTIMQEEAPPGQAGRVMSFFSFSLLGAGPLGAILCGLLVSWIGPNHALMVAAGVMALVVSSVTAWSIATRAETAPAP